MTDDLLPQPRADFISCDQCGATFAVYRSPVCPHPIPRHLPISKQLAEYGIRAEKDGKGFPASAGISLDTAIAIVSKDSRKRKGKKQGPHILIAPEYEQQPWEKIGQGSKRWRAFQYWLALGEGRTYAKASRDLGYTASQTIEDWSRQDNWPLRLEALRARQAEVERNEMEKGWKRRIRQVCTLADSGLTILAAEADSLINELVDKKQAGTMSVKEFMDSYVAIGKFLELLQGRATEHVIHETPAMATQKRLHACAKDIVLFLELDRKRGDSDDQMEENRRDYIEAGASKLQVPEESLSAAVDQLDRIEHQSESVS